MALRPLTYNCDLRAPKDTGQLTSLLGAGGREMFVYFDNDVKVHAPYNAICLADKLRATRRARPRATPAGHVALRRRRPQFPVDHRQGGAARRAG
jgi:hypothetical protein